MRRILSNPAGTKWVNLVPDSEDFSHAGAGYGQWNHVNDSLNTESSEEVVDGVPMTGIISLSDNAMLRTAGAQGSIDADSVFIGGYFKAAKHAWGHISVSATNAIGNAAGGNHWFDLAGGVLGSFAAIGDTPGILLDAGMRPVTGGGYWCWAIIDCLGDSTLGFTFASRPVIGDDSLLTAEDDPEVSIYIGGLTMVDGPMGEIEYVST